MRKSSPWLPGGHHTRQDVTAAVLYHALPLLIVLDHFLVDAREVAGVDEICSSCRHLHIQLMM